MSTLLPVPARVEMTQECKQQLTINYQARITQISEDSCYKGKWREKILFYTDLSLAVSKPPNLSQEWHRGDTFLKFSVWGNCEAENGQCWKTQCYREARKDSQNYEESIQKLNSDRASDRKQSREEILYRWSWNWCTGWAGSVVTLHTENYQSLPWEMLHYVSFTI